MQFKGFTLFMFPLIETNAFCFRICIEMFGKLHIWNYTANILLVKRATFRCLLFLMYFQCIFSNAGTLGCQIDEYTCLFGTKETWRKKQTQRQTKVFNKNPPYSFIWPYSFNWHQFPTFIDFGFFSNMVYSSD